MGWMFEQDATRKDMVKELTAPRESGTVTLRHCLRGNVLYTLRETLNTATGKVERWIGVDLLAKDPSCGWGYKDMDETMGPYYYECPLAYLDEAGETTHARAREWREKVRAHHAHVTAIRNARPGDRVVFVEGTTVGGRPVIEATFEGKVPRSGKRVFVRLANGTLTRCHPDAIARVEPKAEPEGEGRFKFEYAGGATGL